MAIDLINRCRTAAGAYRTNAEPYIGSTVDLSARDVMHYAALLDEAAADLERMRSERGYIIGCNDGFDAAMEQALEIVEHENTKWLPGGPVDVKGILRGIAKQLRTASGTIGGDHGR